MKCKVIGCLLAAAFSYTRCNTHIGKCFTCQGYLTSSEFDQCARCIAGDIDPWKQCAVVGCKTEFRGSGSYCGQHHNPCSEVAPQPTGWVCWRCQNSNPGDVSTCRYCEKRCKDCDRVKSDTCWFCFYKCSTCEVITKVGEYCSKCDRMCRVCGTKTPLKAPCCNCGESGITKTCKSPGCLVKFKTDRDLCKGHAFAKREADRLAGFREGVARLKEQEANIISRKHALIAMVIIAYVTWFLTKLCG